jgi:hypothetical protein
MTVIRREDGSGAEKPGVWTPTLFSGFIIHPVLSPVRPEIKASFWPA